MTKNQIYLIFIGLLLVSNLILSFLLLRVAPPPTHQEPKNIIIEKLKLDDEQIQHYEGLISDHRSKISDRGQTLMILKNKLYHLLVQTHSEGDVEILIAQIADVQKEIEFIHFHHFEDIKLLCHEDQLDEFADLVNQLPKLFAPHPPHKHPTP